MLAVHEQSCYSKQSPRDDHVTPDIFEDFSILNHVMSESLFYVVMTHILMRNKFGSKITSLLVFVKFTPSPLMMNIVWNPCAAH